MIGIVVVSHSAALARGVAELASQMAPDVTVAVAGGTEDGEIGTSLDLVTAALEEADAGDGAVVLTDLGSATMTAEMALELLDDAQRERVVLADAPLVEGAIAAATAAGGGAGLDAVVAAATAAGGGAAEPPPDPAASEAAPEAERRLTLRNPLGLHARPASLLVRRLRGVDAEVRLERTDNGATANAGSVLAVIALAAAGGTELRVTADGPDARTAVDAVAELIEDGFGELDPGTPPDPGAGPAPAGGGGRPRPGADTGDAERSRTGGGDGGGQAAGGRALGPVPAGADGEEGQGLAGLAGAPGLAIGPASRLRTAALEVPEGPGGDEAQERGRLVQARRRAEQALRAEAAGAAQGILAAHLELLDDPELDAAVQEGLAAGARAEVAWRDAVERQRGQLAALDDPVFAARAADVTDVGRRVLAYLLGTETTLEVASGTVVLADDLVPSQVPALAAGGAAGVALAGGGPGSHVAVLARGLGLPLVVGLGSALAEVDEATPVVLDGDRGTLLVDPPADLAGRLTAQRDRALAAAQAARAGAAAPVATVDGVALRVGANVAAAEDAARAVDLGADEFGLVRTELGFLGRDTVPGEDEQVAALTGILTAAAGRPVVVRTLDVGGDKAAPALDLDPVRNGFLGRRGVRWSLAHPEVFAVQLRAVLRAARGHRVRLMFPLVTTVDEVRAARRALDDARAALDAEGVARGDVEEVGIMVEVPAAAVAADFLAPEVDFFSIGSNDLLQYVMAADRTLPEVAALRDPRAPAFLRLVAQVCAAAERAGIWVGVCGETAADPELATLLVGLGVRELSMGAPAIAGVKEHLRGLSLAQARTAAQAATRGPAGVAG